MGVEQPAAAAATTVVGEGSIGQRASRELQGENDNGQSSK